METGRNSQGDLLFVCAPRRNRHAYLHGSRLCYVAVRLNSGAGARRGKDMLQTGWGHFLKTLSKECKIHLTVP